MMSLKCIVAGVAGRHHVTASTRGMALSDTLIKLSRAISVAILSREPDFAAEMKQEYAIGSRVVAMHDFLEGVRALIVDKDNAPVWNPATPQEMTDDMLDAIFAPLTKKDEWKPL